MSIVFNSIDVKTFFTLLFIIENAFLNLKKNFLLFLLIKHVDEQFHIILLPYAAKRNQFLWFPNRTTAAKIPSCTVLFILSLWTYHSTFARVIFIFVTFYVFNTLVNFYFNVFFTSMGFFMCDRWYRNGTTFPRGWWRVLHIPPWCHNLCVLLCNGQLLFSELLFFN